MSRLSFKEKMLWAQLAGIAVVVVFYAHFLQHTKPGHHYFHALVIVLLAVFGIVRILASRSGSVVQDERDRAIAALGARWSNITMWLGLLVILTLYWDRGSLHSTGFLIGILFHLMVLAGSVGILREIVAYRRAA